MVNQVPEKRRKRPPTFQHLPANRAQALKKAWIQKQKIKSKWNAEKRKEGLVGPNRKQSRGEDDVSEGGEAGEAGDEDEDEESVEEHEKPEEKEKDTQSTRHKGAPPTPTPAPFNRRSRKRDVNPASPADSQKPSLRELTKQAYSTSSLHTYKSDPLNRRGSERGRGRGGRGRGRGQPDMRLRMNVMLEKIKRDLA
ncbi:hypothetical protein JAAARDRAFT_560866 [Jaapia argillacea MUCL 33604]|uniref:rRNA-processing protein FYV7 n=1 Tax=Jaapia argillacea MUCL 33604 TaxID=933084 RepID=A0A067Q110_9AGAM|nr:hypothetical protein JAAARDRAFT_560866 [Jaapia argillacea MUCL 33604]